MADSAVRIAVEDPRDHLVQALLRRHLTFAAEYSPPDQVFALDVDGLLDPAVTLYGVRLNSTLLGLGALKRLDARHVEVKSMHIAEEARGRGLGRLMLNHLLDTARAEGFHRVSLETGSMDAFITARRLYADVGFVDCGPFAQYEASEWSTFMTLHLETL